MKIHFQVLVCLIFLIFTNKFMLGQNRLVLNQNIYVNISGNANLVIDNSNTNAITNPTAGAIISENENNVVKWNIGTSTGSYVVPFATSTLVKIPLEVNIVSAGTGLTSSIIFSTYETASDNNTSFPSDVTNMNSDCNNNNGLFAVDRFWRIDATSYTTKPTPIISFGYNNAANEVGGTNTIFQNKLQAQRFNAGLNSWETPQKLFGVANSALSNVNSVSVTPADFYKSWTLVDTLGMIVTKTQSMSICSGQSVFLQGQLQTTSGIYKDTLNAVGKCDTAFVTNLIVNPLPILAVTDNTLCLGNTGIVTATGANSYSWTPNATLSNSNIANPVASPTITTTYTVIGSDLNGCNMSNTVQVIVNPLPVLTTTGNTICFGNSGAILSNGATNYSWTPNTTLSNSNTPNPTANPTVSTIYTVIGSDNNGCSTSNTVQVIVNPLPVITTTGNTICFGNSGAILSNGATNYSWSPNTTLSNSSTANPTANPTVTTIYTVIGSDINGCSATNTVQVIVNPLPLITTTGNTVCIGNSAAILSSGASSYSWSPAASLSNSNIPNPTSNATVNTVYTVIGTSSLGCVNTQTAMVTVNPLPIITTTGTVICIGNSATILSNGASSYSWSPSVSLSNSNIPNPTSNANVTTIYTVTGTSSLGCVNTETALVTVNPLPVITATGNVICIGNSATILSNGASSYSWSPSTTLNNSNIANPTSSANATTIYTVTGTSTLGCVNTETALVTVNPLPSIITTNTAICIGNSGQLSASGAAVYVWSPNIALNTPNVASPIANPTINTIYTVTGTSSLNCTNSNTVLLSVNPLPTISITSPSVICAGESANLTSSGATTYTWSNAAISNSINASPVVPTTYSVFGEDNNNCINTATVLLNVLVTPTLTVSGSNTLCIGNKLTLAANGGDNYIWSTGVTTSSIIVTPTTNLTYSVSAGIAPCIGNQSHSVTIITPLTPSVSATPTVVNYNSTSTISATGNGTFVWSPTQDVSCITCSTTIVKPEGTTVYTVTQTDLDGCVSTNTILIEMDIVCGDFFVPSGFSPNNDQKNDTWCIYNNCIKTLFVQVYNRWGEKVFETDDITRCWDGFYKGTQQGTGVFIYQLNATLVNGEQIIKNGNVTLIR